LVTRIVEARNRGREGGKIITHLGDTMRLIDGNDSKKATSVKVLEKLGKKRDNDPLRGDVEELDFGFGKSGEVRKHPIVVGGVLVGAAVLGFDSSGAEGRDLVLHQGDERRNDDGDAVEEEGGELVAEGFAAACGEEDQARAALQNVHDYFLLLLSKSLKPKRGAQHLEHPRFHR